MRSRRWSAPLALAASVLGSGCAPADPALPTDNGAPEAPRYPAGTAVAVDGRAISEAEIDALARAVAPLSPELTQNGQRRLVLTRLVLEREALGSQVPEGRREAWDLAKRELERLGADLPPHGPPILLRGNTSTMGFATWCAAADAEPGVWLGPVEEIGLTRIVRRLSDEDAALAYLGAPPLTPRERAVEALQFPWAEGLTRDDVERALDRANLEIPAPLWRDIVPLDLRYRMGAESP